MQRRSRASVGGVAIVLCLGFMVPAFGQLQVIKLSQYTMFDYGRTGVYENVEGTLSVKRLFPRDAWTVSLERDWEGDSTKMRVEIRLGNHIPSDPPGAKDFKVAELYIGDVYFADVVVDNVYYVNAVQESEGGGSGGQCTYHEWPRERVWDEELGQYVLGAYIPQEVDRAMAAPGYEFLGWTGDPVDKGYVPAMGEPDEKQVGARILRVTPEYHIEVGKQFYVTTLFGVPVPAGTGVTASLPATRAATGVTLDFSEITSPGHAILKLGTSSSATPAGFQPAIPERYYDVTSTATYAGPISVCVNYDDLQFKGDRSAARLMHSDGGGWVDCTSSVDAESSLVYGTVDSLSRFMVMEPSTSSPIRLFQNSMHEFMGCVNLTVVPSGNRLTTSIVKVDDNKGDYSCSVSPSSVTPGKTYTVTSCVQVRNLGLIDPPGASDLRVAQVRVYDGWTGATTAPTTLSVVDVLLQHNPYYLRVKCNPPSGGAVSLGEACWHVFPTGMTVPLEATPAAGWHFAEWTGLAVDLGCVDNPTSPAATLDIIRYFELATTQCVMAARFGADAASAPVPQGNGVTVVPVDEASGSTPVRMTFDQVTQAGTASVTVSGSGPTAPAGFQLGDPATYYDISTTALYSGQIQVCINYDGVVFASEPRLFHFEGGNWVDCTTSVDTAAHTVCGVVDSLSPFALFEALSTSLELAIDIQPNRVPNEIYLDRNYTIYVAVLGGPKFDVTRLDSATVKFGPSGTEASPVRGPTLEDVNNDGYMDALYGFLTSACGFVSGDTVGHLTGAIAGQVFVDGSDSVVVVTP